LDNNHGICGNSQKQYNNWSALRASQPANAAANPASKLKFAAGLAADPQRLGVKKSGNEKGYRHGLQ
jgi:hypothetical protein